MNTETMSKGGLPRIQWSPVVAGVLCAIAVHIVLGLFGAAFGFAAEPADSEGVGLAAGIWGLLVPLVASAIGAFICVRIAREADRAGSYLHGALVWCIGLIAGALFISGSLASGAMSSATAASGNVRGGFARSEVQAPANEARAEEAAEGAAAAAGAGGLGALLGLAGAFLGAAAGRRALTGEGARHGRGGGLIDRMQHMARGRGGRDAEYDRGYREGIAAARGQSGIVTSTTRPGEGTISGEVRAGDDPTLHH
jgi:hypothetical protein